MRGWGSRSAMLTPRPFLLPLVLSPCAEFMPLSTAPGAPLSTTRRLLPTHHPLSRIKCAAPRYEGNRADCELYASAGELLARRLEWMEAERGLAPGAFSAHVRAPTTGAAGAAGAGGGTRGNTPRGPSFTSPYESSRSEVAAGAGIYSPLCERAARAYHRRQLRRL